MGVRVQVGERKQWIPSLKLKETGTNIRSMFCSLILLTDVESSTAFVVIAASYLTSKNAALSTVLRMGETPVLIPVAQP